MRQGHWEIRVNLDKALIKNVTKAACAEGTHAALDHLATVSKGQVPLRYGPLKNSCTVSVSDDGREGAVSYDTAYAVIQHESMGFNHPNGRKAKYLEDPANDGGVKSAMAALIAAAFKSRM